MVERTIAAKRVEAMLVEEGAVTQVQVDRALRVNQYMRKKRRVGDILIEMGQLARAEYERISRLHLSRLTVAEILHEQGVLDDVALAAYEEARKDAPQSSDRELIVEAGLAAEEAFLRAVGLRYDTPYLEPDVGLVDLGVFSRASFPYLQRHCALPLRIGDGALTVILADPLDQQIIGELKRIYSLPIKVCCAPAEKIQDALRALQHVRGGAVNPLSTGLEYRDITEVEGDESTGEGAVAILDYLLLRALQMRASDLHIEPQQKRVRVRVRVDGVLQPLTDLPASFAPQVISRVKVLASINIAERRMHQDGRIAVLNEGREVDVRVSTYASTFGETLVLRLLDRRRGLVPLEDLGFAPRVLSALREIALRTSSGLMLTVGPTGSGKTTTMYSFVDFINDPSRKAISCEDPVEYVLEGVTQCSVNEKTGPTFADSLRAIVRQDPDIIIVGEVRDPLTANLAVEAALTGHKVLSTFHTEDAVGAILRLADMGVEPFLVSSTVSCIVAQRLVRRVCAHCRQPAEPGREDLRFLSASRQDLAGMTLVHGEGCAECGGTGYRGRVGIHEVLMPDDDFRDAVLRRAPSRELRALARSLPAFMTLQETGLLVASAGVTTLSEIISGVPRDRDARPATELRAIAKGRRS